MSAQRAPTLQNNIRNQVSRTLHVEAEEQEHDFAEELQRQMEEDIGRAQDEDIYGAEDEEAVPLNLAKNNYF